jgi:hypothetical protein
MGRASRRGQTSLEFLFLIGFMFIIFMVFFIVIQERTVDISRNKDYVSLKEVNNIVKYEVKNAQYFDNGYRRTFWMPPRIYGRTYQAEISADHNESFYNLSGVEYIDFFDSEVYGTVSFGWNTVCKRDSSVHMNDCTGPLY